MKTLALLAALCGQPAFAEAPCHPYDNYINVLKERYGEEIVVTAQVDATLGSVLQITVNPETLTWTMIIIDGNGIACGVGSGTQWSPTPAGEEM